MKKTLKKFEARAAVAVSDATCQATLETSCRDSLGAAANTVTMRVWLHVVDNLWNVVEGATTDTMGRHSVQEACDDLVAWL